MAKPKPREAKKGLDEWMGTYGDMITLLMCFFVILYSMSSIDEAKFKALAESYAGKPVLISGGMGSIIADSNVGLMPEFNAKKPPDELDETEQKSLEEARQRQEQLNKMASDFKTYFADNTMTSKIVVEETGEYVRITFPDGMLFDSGKAHLKEDAIGALGLVADELRKYSEFYFRVEGHTDNVPQRKEPYPSNRHLSSARADTVVEYLVNQKGFNPKMLSAEGMSEYWPIDTNDTPEGRANNRRVEIKVYAPQANSGLLIPVD